MESSRIKRFSGRWKGFYSKPNPVWKRRIMNKWALRSNDMTVDASFRTWPGRKTLHNIIEERCEEHSGDGRATPQEATTNDIKKGQKSLGWRLFRNPKRRERCKTDLGKEKRKEHTRPEPEMKKQDLKYQRWEVNYGHIEARRWL